MTANLALTLSECIDGADVRFWREQHGLSLRALERLSGVSERTLRRIERGDHPATPAVVETLAKALKAEPREIESAHKSVEPGSREELRDVIPWELDPCAQYAVHCHQDGLSSEQIAELMGLTRRTVEEIEKTALAKLRDSGAELRGFLALDSQ